MGVGTGIILIVAGAVLFGAIEVDLPYVDDDALGLILLLAGIATLIISVVMKVNRPEAGIGTGVFMIVVGAILAWAIDINLNYIDDYAMGWILIVAGLVSVAATVVVNIQRRRSRYRYGQDPYGQQPPYGQQQNPYAQGGYPPDNRPRY
jgi:hypothetical protein